MAISDTVVGNLTTLYLLVIAAIKAYGLAAGRSFSGSCVIVLSTAVVALILVAALTWDVSRKATRALMMSTRDRGHEMCRGGICWHGVAVKSPASQVRFRLPQHQNM
ncbi:transmembrane protein [Perilla frutescens var. hirtella]|uniref:Transmembrane protein n=1 Tax=Perilla frutescens var. hirtella TaxID=608512 RepID=A0AAD4NYX9_PERFH|nr:transmembrane protein [Perilla frutescens var. hirtella]KAH6820329.1 transmembrane protein [Perilla frutescens var. hirtella]